MNYLQILLLQSKMTASFEIIAMLLGAAIIGSVTAWFYAKSVNNKRIEELESEINKNKKEAEKIKKEKNNLQKTFAEKYTKIEQVTKEGKTLKSQNSAAVNDTTETKLKNKITEQLLAKEHEALPNLRQGMHLLDYNSFGTATGDEKDDLKMISGIGPFIEERLNALDIYTFRQISKFTAKDIEIIDDAIECFAGRIERDEWIAQASELIHDEEKQNELLQQIRAKKSLIYYDRIGIANKEEADDLTEISGIGGWINKKLNALDIYTFKQISNFNNEDVEIVTDAIEFFPGRIERDEWIQQARELIRIEISKSEHLQRISVMKNRIYYDRLGIAHKHHANNLTLIKGISNWVEESLNALEIYTFTQISKLTTEDIVIISDILEISPDRINQDHWVEQALELTKASQKKIADNVID
ncbi:hypothetical protein QUH73_19725 [Labilibaculum sp. K2S]|uniref:hypothetical protein n=1 Tax=Labilibaculum sp. K2S TaxID=3056386 RepID=UPI0025A43FC9|nr:hypothetical protein [Labilibaculum sp. K2S]MDM8162057.1 hypothetical protein [Labilibaculum sp. K2S]